MKSILLSLSLCATLVLAGCSGDPQERAAANQAELASAGEIIGKLPDGREVHRYWIQMQYGEYDRLYVVEGSKTTSTNWTVRRGKTHYTQACAVIDGAAR